VDEDGTTDILLFFNDLFLDDGTVWMKMALPRFFHFFICLVSG
jgi:hypothetical protein